MLARQKFSILIGKRCRCGGVIYCRAAPVKCRVDCCGMSSQQSAASCLAFGCLIVNWFVQSFDNNQTLKSKKCDVRANVDLLLKSFAQSIVIDTGAESTRGRCRKEMSCECCLFDCCAVCFCLHHLVGALLDRDSLAACSNNDTMFASIMVAAHASQCVQCIVLMLCSLCLRLMWRPKQLGHPA